MKDFKNYSSVVSMIKEKLHNFNLPMIPVYTEETVLRVDKTYIKDNSLIVRCKENSSGELYLDTVGYYSYGIPILNNTKKFIINSSDYDLYTHYYLGEFLRFYRDYNNIDLMSLYNCYYGEKLYNTTQLDIGINTDDEINNYYVIPVKFNKCYTVAVDSDKKYEITCILYGNKIINPEHYIAFHSDAHKYINGSKFNRPFTYHTYFDFLDEDYYYGDEYLDLENNLMMIIKLPKGVSSSIVVLEGNFIECANVIDNNLITTYISGDPRKCLSKNSLITCNDEVSYPFSPRLVEYIMDNAITPESTIEMNIERVQDDVNYITPVGNYGIWDDNISRKIISNFYCQDFTKGFSPKYSNLITDSEGKNLWNKKPKRFIDRYSDLTGFVDKDVEDMIGLMGCGFIKFDNGKPSGVGGSIGTTFTTVSNNQVLEKISVPTWAGHAFIGYYYNDKKYYDSDGNPVSTIDGNNTTITMVAKWG